MSPDHIIAYITFPNPSYHSIMLLWLEYVTLRVSLLCKFTEQAKDRGGIWTKEVRDGCVMAEMLVLFVVRTLLHLVWSVNQTGDLRDKCSPMSNKIFDLIYRFLYYTKWINPLPYWLCRKKRRDKTLKTGYTNRSKPEESYLPLRS